MGKSIGTPAPRPPRPALAAWAANYAHRLRRAARLIATGEDPATRHDAVNMFAFGRQSALEEESRSRRACFDGIGREDVPGITAALDAMITGRELKQQALAAERRAAFEVLPGGAA